MRQPGADLISEIARLAAVAKEHKRAEGYHRRRAAEARERIKELTDTAKQRGIRVEA